MSLEEISIIVAGSLNTDIVAYGLPELVGSGRQTIGKELQIFPGGKARNIAQMSSILTGRKNVAMVGKTSKDPFNLWKPPIDALLDSGVNIDYIKVNEFKENPTFPGIAIINVDIHGNNQISVLPGISRDISSKDIEDASPLFVASQKNNGHTVLSFELLLPTAVYFIQKANSYNLKVLIEPGALDEKQNYEDIWKLAPYIVKPNEHEARILTGIEINNFKSAQKSAQYFIEKGVQNVLITAGKDGAYLFGEENVYFPIPNLEINSPKNSTGCGDQVMATLVAYLSAGKNLIESSRLAILAGTLQYHKPGVSPVTKEEIEKYSLG